MDKRGRLGFTILLDLFAVSFVLVSLTYEKEVRIVPLLVAVPTAVILTIQTIREALSRKRDSAEKAESQPEWSAVMRIILWICIFSALIFFFGFYLSIFVFTFSFLTSVGEMTRPRGLTVSMTLVSCIYIFFHLLLKVVLWPGVLPTIVPDFLGGGVLPPL